MTTETENNVWDRLKEPFTDEEIEWRVQQCGQKNGRVWAILVPYIQARAIMDRLDDVTGPENWTDTYTLVNTDKESGFLCTLGIHVPVDGEMRWIYRQDGAPTTNIEAIKGGISDALKRAAVKFGMGRYLYKLDAFWADNPQDGYPPKGERTIIIVKKDKPNKTEFRAWCYPPSLNNEPTRKLAPKPAPPEPTPAEVRQKLLARVDTAEKLVYPKPAIAAARKKYLNVADPKDATDDLLEAYLAHTKVKYEEAKRLDIVKELSTVELELVRADTPYPFISPKTLEDMSDKRLQEHLDLLKRIKDGKETYVA